MTRSEVALNRDQERFRVQNPLDDLEGCLA
jgi:hypothetical protein